MKSTLSHIGIAGFLAAALWGSPRVWSQEAQPPPVTPPTDAVQVQTRGPVHEAYAQPVEQNPQPGPVVAKQPPDPITEVPPDQKPEGDNVQWIPGYWAWDDARNDFLWVSGFWRNVPPGRKWVPGHWTRAEGGWQWVAGFWAAASQPDVTYQPPPPDSLDYGPATPAPDDDSTYVPGCWLLRGGSYAWRPGFWTAAQPGYTWCPDHYSYTPAGCVFVSGYWDYDLADRGLLFAPVCFNSPVWQTPGWSYTPNYCVDYSGLIDSLFCRSGYPCYYFGNYYTPGCYDRGFRPWWLNGARHHDPLFAHAFWEHRHDPGWYHGLRDTYLGRLRGTAVRPPLNLAEHHQFLRDGVFREHRGVQVVSRLDHFHNAHVPLTRIDHGQVVAHHRAAEQFRAVSHERQALERPGSFRDGKPAGLSLAHVPVARGQYEHVMRSGAPVPAHHGEPAPHASRSVPPGFAAEHRPAPEVHHAPAVAHEPRPGFERAPAAPNVQHVQPPRTFGYAPHQVAPAHHPAPAASHPPAFHSMGHPAPAFHGSPAGGHGGGHGGGGHGGGGHGGHHH
jgi:hypothetical protein